MGWDGPMTHRQYAAWQDWLKRQWNEPDRTDHYLMELICEVIRGRVKEPERVKPRKLEFEFQAVQQSGQGGKDTELSREEQVVISKSVWRMAGKISRGEGRQPRKGRGVKR